MHLSSVVSACLLASAAAGPIHSKRSDHPPSDTSASAQAYFVCNSMTLNNPGGSSGQGEGGEGFSHAQVSVRLSDGTVLTPGSDGCVQDKAVSKSNLAQLCTIQHDSLDNGSIELHVIYQDIAGECSMNFGYKGYSYSVNTAYGGAPTQSCGWLNKGFQAYSNTLTDVCYFNA